MSADVGDGEDVRTAGAAVQEIAEDRSWASSRTPCALQSGLVEADLEAELRYRSVFEDAPICLVTVDMSGAKAFVEHLRKAGVVDFGLYFDSHPEDVMKCVSMAKVLDLNRAALELYGGEDKSRFKSAADRLFDRTWWPVFKDGLLAVAEGRHTFEGEHTIRTLKGEKRVVSLRAAIPPQNEPMASNVVISLVDITEYRLTEDRLRQAAMHDALTGLYNRAYFQEEMRRVQGGRFYPVTIVSTDLDGLKAVNDVNGLLAGDRRLKAYGRILRSSFRRSDVVARVGSDEFAVILPRTGEAAADSLRGRLEARIAAHNQAHPEVPLSASFGAETSYGVELPLEEALKRAERKMHRDRLTRSVNSSHGVVEVLLLALSAKDYVCEGHTKRVRDLAIKLGEAVGLSRSELGELALLGEVHDLGKVGISDQVLFKEGPLAGHEELEMRQHSAIGYRIAKASKDLAHISELILYHHESWDGSGYPAGLKGEEIPIACRILAVADAYDAMTNDRPYRKARNTEQALEELSRCAGSQFDPQLVEMFARIVRQQTDGPHGSV
ncbi:MAG: HD domain-containing phosphohydrolase [Chloroflexota bacterium]